MRIGHWQLESKCGDFEGNLAKVVLGLEQAQRERVEVVCFPECFLTGYPDTEELARKHAFALDSPQALKLLDGSDRFDPTLIVGFNELRGRDLYNTALVAHRGTSWAPTVSAPLTCPSTSRGATSPSSSAAG